MAENNIHNIARGIIIVDNHILLVSHPNWDGNTFYLPGGHIELKEAAKEALIRELKEEVGLDFKVGRFLGCFEYIFEPEFGLSVCHTHEYNFLFIANSFTIKDTTPLPQQEADLILTWVDLNRLKEIELLPNALAYLIPKWLKENNDQSFITAK